MVALGAVAIVSATPRCSSNRAQLARASPIRGGGCPQVRTRCDVLLCENFCVLGGSDEQSPPEFDVVIVGAGFAGLYMALPVPGTGALGSSCSRLVAVWVARGTGTATRVRGAMSRACSTRTSSPTSSQQEWAWTERYAGQPEILRYLEYVADRFELWPDHPVRHPGDRGDVRRDAAARWTVRTDADSTSSARSS